MQDIRDLREIPVCVSRERGMGKAVSLCLPPSLPASVSVYQSVCAPFFFRGEEEQRNRKKKGEGQRLDMRKGASFERDTTRLRMHDARVLAYSSAV